MPLPIRVIVGLLCVLGASVARGEEAFYKVRLHDLKITDGAWPKPGDSSNYDAVYYLLRPTVRVDGAEAYVDFGRGDWSSSEWPKDLGSNCSVVVRADAAREITGTLIIPTVDMKGTLPLKFAIPADAAKPDARGAFYAAKSLHYDSLVRRGVPGGAWFRYQARTAEAQLSDNERSNLPSRSSAGTFNRVDSAEDTFALFSGGRAISENLQLDRVIPTTQRAEEPTIPFDQIEGIKTTAMDWKPLIEGKSPKLDPLAAYIPADQHAIFFPSFVALKAVMDEAEANGLYFLQAMEEPRSEDAGSCKRYQRQLNLPIDGVVQVLGPAMLNGVAITGGDAYMRTGTDMTVLLDARNADAVLTALQVDHARTRVNGGERHEGKVGKLSYFGRRSSDRRECSYVARLGETNVVAVTNSPKQLERLSAVLDGAESIAKTPEYTFFRDRYKIGEGEESVFVVLTDATIRRWCSPRQRILDSRRTAAAAVMADLQAEHLGKLVNASEPVPVTTGRPVNGMGDLQLTAAGIASAGYGTLEFLTPISELPAEQATKQEKELYDRWREGYEKNWSAFFDPIAIRLSIKPTTMSADVTCIPLIMDSDYRGYVDLAGNARLTPASGDPHGALLHYVFAIDRKSKTMKEFTDFSSQFAPGIGADPFSWLGSSVSIYLDADPFWQEVAKAQDKEEFVEDNWHRLPVALHVASESPLKLGVFVTALRAYFDTTAPGMANWQPVKHGEHAYVKVTSKAVSDNFALYYTTLPDALVITLNEDLIRRAVERYSQRVAATQPAAVATTQPTTRPWLGQQMAASIEADGIALLSGLAGDEYQLAMKHAAWDNLPILNEWKRLYPDADPAALHERLWHARLLDPAGGGYQWNEKDQTMESVTYGHPAAPKQGLAAPPQLQKITGGAMGITFEHQGIRGRAELQRK